MLLIYEVIIVLNLSCGLQKTRIFRSSREAKNIIPRRIDSSLYRDFKLPTIFEIIKEKHGAARKEDSSSESNNTEPHLFDSAYTKKMNINIMEIFKIVTYIQLKKKILFLDRQLE